jgi:hypothetical protein
MEPNQIPQSTEIPIPEHSNHSKPKFNLDSVKEKFNSLPKNKKITVVAIAVMFSLIFLLLILTSLLGKKQIAIIATPSPSPISVTPIPNVILNASRYATDSAVLKIESDLNGIQKQLDSSDVKQSDLSLPNMDFNINFNQ